MPRRMTIYQEPAISDPKPETTKKISKIPGGPTDLDPPLKSSKIPKISKTPEPKIPKKRGRKPKILAPPILPIFTNATPLFPEIPEIPEVGRSTRTITKRRATIYQEALNSDSDTPLKEATPSKILKSSKSPKSLKIQKIPISPKSQKPKPNRRMTVYVPADPAPIERIKKQRRNTIFQATPFEMEKFEKKFEEKNHAKKRPQKPKKRQRYASSSDSEPLIHLRRTENKMALTTPLSSTLDPPRKKTRKEMVPAPNVEVNSPFKLPVEVAGTFTLLSENFYGRHVKSAPLEPVIVCNCLPSSNCSSNCLNQITWIECDATSCPCGENCQNRKIQEKKFCRNLQVFATERKGWGVRASKEIKERALIAEYMGEVICKEEMERRAGDEYLMDSHFYAMYLGPNQQIDSHRMGSICRFVNHSCNPNCEMKKVIVLGRGRMVLLSLRDIKEGEELTYDYNFQLYKGSVVQQCECGEENCRGQIKQQEPPRRKSSGSEMEVSGRKRLKSKPRPPVHPKSFLRRLLKTPPKFAVHLKPEDEDPKGDFLLIVSRPKKVSLNANQSIQNGGLTDLMLEICGELRGVEDKEGKLLDRVEITQGEDLQTIDRLAILMDMNLVEMMIKANPHDLLGFNYSIKLLLENAIKLHGPNSPPGQAGSSLLTHFKSIKEKFHPKLAPRVDFSILQQFMDRTPDLVRGRKKRGKEGEGDIIQCICGIYLEEGLMIQCKRCCCWQHVNCVISPADVPAADPGDQDYFCEKCEGRIMTPADYEVPRPPDSDSEPDVKEFVALMRGDLQVRVGDAVYVLRDIDLPATQEPLHSEENSDKNLDISPATSLKTGAEVVPPSDIDKIDKTSIISPAGPSKPGKSDKTDKNSVGNVTEGLKTDQTVNISPAEPTPSENSSNLEAKNSNPLISPADSSKTEIPANLEETSSKPGNVEPEPSKNPLGPPLPSVGGKHTYKTITKINYEECDIFRVEKLWKTAEGRRMVYGHHHLRPHETFREPTRKFYSNELMQYGLVETIDIDLVIGRCWVLDNFTYFKGRPLESQERHVYVCEHKMNKQKRQFDKIPSKQRPSICTKEFAFWTFQTKLKQARKLLPENDHSKPPLKKLTQSASWTALRADFELRLTETKKLLRSPRLARLEDKCELLLKNTLRNPPKTKKEKEAKKKEIKERKVEKKRRK